MRFTLEVDMAFVPRFPRAPDCVSDEDYEAALEKIREAFQGGSVTVDMTYDTEVKDLLVTFPMAQHYP